MKTINPNYYPKPVYQVPLKKSILSVYEKAGNFKFEDVPPGFWISENELIDMYESCSKLIHANNSFTEDLDLKQYENLFPIWLTKIINLLNMHMVTLIGSKFAIYFAAQVQGKVGPDIWIFENITNALPPEFLNITAENKEIDSMM